MYRLVIMIIYLTLISVMRKIVLSPCIKHRQ